MQRKNLPTMASPPDWLKQLADSAASCLTPVDVLAPIGCHFHEAADGWEVSLFVAETEVIGGHKDGVLRPSRYFVDVAALTDLFSNVLQVHWQALPLGAADELGTHLCVSGVCSGQAVTLRVLARAPERFSPGRKARVYERRWEEVW